MRLLTSTFCRRCCVLQFGSRMQAKCLDMRGITVGFAKAVESISPGVEPRAHTGKAAEFAKGSANSAALSQVHFRERSHGVAGASAGCIPVFGIICRNHVRDGPLEGCLHQSSLSAPCGPSHLRMRILCQRSSHENVFGLGLCL